jgi:uncharacterized protein YdeI (YjbR/CyaY-like superfamily)
MQSLYFTSSDQWHKWLTQNHAKQNVVWLTFYKASSGRPSLDYENAVDEALCFGWIDSIIKNVDENSYARKFTRRNPGSKWSEINKSRVARLIAEKRMTAAGMRSVEQAKADGSWDKPDRPPRINTQMPTDFESALKRDKLASHNFYKLAPTYQKQFIIWIVMAKRPETRQRRIEESIRLLVKGEKLGLR